MPHIFTRGASFQQKGCGLHIIHIFMSGGRSRSSDRTRMHCLSKSKVCLRHGYVHFVSEQALPPKGVGSSSAPWAPWRPMGPRGQMMTRPLLEGYLYQNPPKGVRSSSAPWGPTGPVRPHGALLAYGAPWGPTGPLGALDDPMGFV